MTHHCLLFLGIRSLCHGCLRAEISKFLSIWPGCNLALAACATLRMIDICVTVARSYLCDYEFSAHWMVFHNSECDTIK